MAQYPNKTDDFLGLFLKAEPRVYAYIRSQVPHRADAEDVLQETAATLWSKFDEFRQGSDFIAWAYQVARFKVQHLRDRQSRRRRLFSQAFVELVADKTGEMTEQTSELQSMLVECMKQLPDADREVVEQCYGSESTLAAVAERLGRSVNTIKSVLKRARRSLYECIRRAQSREERQ
ncbi:MAG: sigma-70 family RNA polymerase sigma factor [Pirellulaceae bacterium]|nr:sigma-70 family RNA polymerase sigma factor [Pirellulaceae bacterium]